MKIIDILNIIARGEQPPKKILFNDKVYKWNDGVDYENEDGQCVEFLLSQQCICNNFLNDEVEILETTITYKQDNIENNKQDKIEKIEPFKEEVNIFEFALKYPEVAKVLKSYEKKIAKLIEVVNKL